MRQAKKTAKLPTSLHLPLGGHSVPESDVKRRFSRSLAHFLEIYAPLSDDWTFRNNSIQPAYLLFDSAKSLFNK